MTRTFLTALLALAACAPSAPDTAFRAPGAPIWSLALFEQSSLEGAWHEVAGFPLSPGCTPGAVSFGPGGASASGGGCFLPAGRGALAPAGPGRFTSAGETVWVLWLDADNRTLVLGTPSGRFGAVLNRDPAIPDDRMTAAARVLAANGYDTARLARR